MTTDSTAVRGQHRMSEIVKARDLEQLFEVLADDLEDHDPADGQPSGAEGIVWFWRGFLDAFPDAAMEYHLVEGDGDLVTMVATVRGTHTGEYQGHPPTGRSFAVRRIQVGRWRDGKLVERWGLTDEAGILEQLGLGPR